MTVRLLDKDICLQIAKVFDREEQDERELLFYIPLEMFGKVHKVDKCNADYIIDGFCVPPYFVDSVDP